MRLRIDFLLQMKYFISTAKAKQLRMQREIFVVHCEDDTKHMNKISEKKAEIFFCQRTRYVHVVVCSSQS
jgi:hypothetical protein